MGAYLRGVLIKKFQSKEGRLFERDGNLRVGANLSIYGISFFVKTHAFDTAVNEKMNSIRSVSAKYKILS